MISVRLRDGRARTVSSNVRSRRAGGPEAFQNPRGLALAPNGDLFVSDRGQPQDDGVDVRVDRRTGRQERVYTDRRPRRMRGTGAFYEPVAVGVKRPARVER